MKEFSGAVKTIMCGTQRFTPAPRAVDARIVRDADTADGHDRKQKKGLVGVRLWPRLESHCLLARR